MSALKVTVVFFVLFGQVLTRATLDQNCIMNADKSTCREGYCCVRDEFLSTRTYCRLFGQAQAPCSTQPTDLECPCVQGFRCATDVDGHITSLFGRCYAIPANTTAAPSTSSSTTTSTTPTIPTSASTTTTSTSTQTTPTLTTQFSSTTTTTTASTTPFLTTTTTELPTTSVLTNTPFLTEMFTTTTFTVPTKAVITEALTPETVTDQSLSASTGNEVVTQKASDPLNIIVPIG